MVNSFIKHCLRIVSCAFDFAIEIPLGDARLLEEHELTNVLNQLPEELAEEAFNELFTG